MALRSEPTLAIEAVSLPFPFPFVKLPGGDAKGGGGGGGGGENADIGRGGACGGAGGIGTEFCFGLLVESSSRLNDDGDPSRLNGDLSPFSSMFN